MSIEDIKAKMLLYRDFYGSDFSDTQAINKARTKKELAEIIDRHESHLEDMLSDAKSHLASFKKQIGVSILKSTT
jgi:hypothetical protein